MSPVSKSGDFKNSGEFKLKNSEKSHPVVVFSNLKGQNNKQSSYIMESGSLENIKTETISNLCSDQNYA